MTRPGWVPGVAASMSTDISSEPEAGTSKDWFEMRMYLRWSKTLKSAPVVNGVAATVTELVTTVRVPSPGPYGAAHFASYSTMSFHPYFATVVGVSADAWPAPRLATTSATTPAATSAPRRSPLYMLRPPAACPNHPV